MTETDHLILAAAMAVIYLIGPAAVWRVTKTVAEMARCHPAIHMGLIGTTTTA